MSNRKFNILHALDDPKIFAPFFKGDSWNAWRVFLASLFALPMTPEATRDLSAAHWSQHAITATTHRSVVDLRTTKRQEPHPRARRVSFLLRSETGVRISVPVNAAPS